MTILGRPPRPAHRLGILDALSRTESTQSSTCYIRYQRPWTPFRVILPESCLCSAPSMLNPVSAFRWPPWETSVWGLELSRLSATLYLTRAHMLTMRALSDLHTWRRCQTKRYGSVKLNFQYCQRLTWGMAGPEVCNSTRRGQG